jgi:ankyrin repeat protein
LTRVTKETTTNRICISQIKFCLDSGALFDTQDGQGSTVLMYAVVENYTDIVRLLLDRSNKKSNLNVQDSNGKTAVHLVVSPLEYGSYENVEILELLASHGADLNVKDSNGKTPMYYACLQVRENSMHFPFMVI